MIASNTAQIRTYITFPEGNVYENVTLTSQHYKSRNHPSPILGNGKDSKQHKSLQALGVLRQ